MRKTILLAFTILLTAVCLATEQPLTSCRQLAEALSDGRHLSQRFDIEATLIDSTFPGSPIFEDATGALAFGCSDVQPAIRKMQLGDSVQIVGEILRLPKSIADNPTVIAHATRLRLLRHGPPPVPAAVRAPELSGDAYNNRLVSIEGTVLDAFQDEIDPNIYFLSALCDGQTVHVATPLRAGTDAKARALIGAQTRMTGICHTKRGGTLRHVQGPQISVPSFDQIRVLVPPPQNPFALPDVETLLNTRPSDFPAQKRYSSHGIVLATWNLAFIIQTESGAYVRVKDVRQTLPQPGETIDVIGFPESDLYNLYLNRAQWRPSVKPVSPKNQAVLDTPIRSLLADSCGRTVMRSDLLGRLLRIRGVVRSVSQEPEGDKYLYLEDDGFLIRVNVTTHPDVLDAVSVGCKIAATGICVTDIETWRPSASFPHIRGFQLVMRSPDDLTILRRPSWWTPQRLLIVLGVALLILFGSLAINFVLRRLIMRRSRELEREIAARIGSDLKVGERTRLAVELHDAISQNLTGVALELQAANAYADAAPAAMRPHLDIAFRTLGSCRDELRNCLWDLRNDTLGEADMNDAIRRTLAPHLGTAALHVAFAVPREKFTDNTAHTVLHIIRELVANAIRHGHATDLRVAGALEDDTFLFSVRDNGCGFDPATCPGFEQGHFGLLGIRERIKGFGGTFELRSAPGCGTYARIAITLPQEKT